MVKRVRRCADVARVGRAGLRTVVAGGLLLLSACGPGTPPAATPAEPDPFAEAGAAFEAGDYPAAANAYRRALAAVEVGNGDRRLALYRMSLMYVLPESPIHDRQAARSFLEQLEIEFPESPGGVEIRSILALQERIDDLRANIDSMHALVDSLAAERDRQDVAAGELNAELDRVRLQLDQVQLQLETTESELEKLRAIDLGRRPRE